MSDPYVSFPGTAGNYISTPDTNLLDADNAHIEQSLGDWVAQVSANVEVTQEAGAISGGFGNNHLRAEMLQAARFQLRCPNVSGVSALPVSGAESRVSVRVWPTVTETFRIFVEQWDAGGVSLGTAGTSTYDLTAGVAETIEYTLPANTRAFIRINIDTASGTDIPVGEALRISTICVREGTDATFVPSMDVVGTLFEETVPADMPVVYTKGQDLRIGDGWAGNGQIYRRYDGPDSSAPLVAEFKAADVAGALA